MNINNFWESLAKTAVHIGGEVGNNIAQTAQFVGENALKAGETIGQVTTEATKTAVHISGEVSSMISLYPGHKANEVAESAQKRYEQALAILKKEEVITNQLAQEYGQLQLNIISDTIKRFVIFIENIGRKSSMSEKQLLEGIDFSVQQIKEYKTAAIEAEKFFMAGVKSAGAAVAGYGGALCVATSIGAASTGTAISTLSGAAAWNATLAWFGGGAIAAGGGGMALGSLVLGGITILPALAIGGFLAATEGEKAMTKAREYEAKVNKAISEMASAQYLAKKVRLRITELKALLESINDRVIQCLSELEELPQFNPSRDAQKFQQTVIQIKALGEILKTPVLNGDGQINLDTVIILQKYRVM